MEGERKEVMYQTPPFLESWTVGCKDNELFKIDLTRSWKRKREEMRGERERSSICVCVKEIVKK